MSFYRYKVLGKHSRNSLEDGPIINIIIDVVEKPGILKFVTEYGDEKWHGTCEFKTGEETLEIKNLVAAPKSNGLGTILIHATCLQSLPFKRITTAATAQEAMRFYLFAGFHPAPESPQRNAELTPLKITPSSKDNKEGFALRLKIGRLMTSKWSGERKQILELANAVLRLKNIEYQKYFA